MFKKIFIKLRQKITYKMVLFLGLVIYTIAMVMICRNTILVQKDKYVDRYIKALMDETNYKTEIKIDEKFSFLSTIAECISESDFKDTDDINKCIDIIRKTEGSNYVYLTIDEEVFGDKPFNLIFMEEDYYKRSMEGERGISEIKVANNTEYVMFSVPVFKNDKVIGVLQCGYDINVFENLIENSAFNKKGETFVAQNDGILITRPESIGDSTNLFELLSRVESGSEKTLKKLKTKLENGVSGVVQYETGKSKNKRYICYYNIPKCNWYAVTIASESAIDPQAVKIIKASSYLLGEIIASFVVYVGAIVFFEYMKKRKVK